LANFAKTSPQLVNKIKKIEQLASNFLAKRKEHEQALMDYDESTSRLESATATGDNLKTAITKRLDVLKQRKPDSLLNESKKEYQNVHADYGSNHSITQKLKEFIDFFESLTKDLQHFQDTLSNIIKYWEKKQDVIKYDFFCCPNDEHFITDIKNAIEEYNKETKRQKEAKKKSDGLMDECNKALQKHQEEVRSFDNKLMLQAISNPSDYFTVNACQKFNLSIYVEELSVSVDVLTDAILDYFNKQKAVFKNIVQMFMDSTSPTIIDTIFNSNRLRMCREYKTVDIKKVKDVISAVDSLLKEYEDVSKIKQEK